MDRMPPAARSPDPADGTTHHGGNQPACVQRLVRPEVRVVTGNATIRFRAPSSISRQTKVDRNLLVLPPPTARQLREVMRQAAASDPSLRSPADHERPFSASLDGSWNHVACAGRRMRPGFCDGREALPWRTGQPTSVRRRRCPGVADKRSEIMSLRRYRSAAEFASPIRPRGRKSANLPWVAPDAQRRWTHPLSRRTSQHRDALRRAASAVCEDGEPRRHVAADRLFLPANPGGKFAADRTIGMPRTPSTVRRHREPVPHKVPESGSIVRPTAAYVPEPTEGAAAARSEPPAMSASSSTPGTTTARGPYAKVCGDRAPARRLRSRRTIGTAVGVAAAAWT